MPDLQKISKDLTAAKLPRLPKQLAQLARISLCRLPTPLYEAKKFSQALHGPTVYIKRDDLTGLDLIP